MKTFSAEPFEKILIDEKERLNRSYAAFAINNREILIVESIPERVLQNLVVPIILSLVG